MASKKEEKIGEALLKVALGYQIAEVTEEYAEVDGALKLTKRKKTKKDIPPDLKAVQLLLADTDTDFSKMSDQDLERERDRLLAELELKKAKTVGGVSAVVEEPKKDSLDGLDGGRYATNNSSSKEKSVNKAVKGKGVKAKSVKGRKSAGKSTAKKNKEAKA